MSEFIFVYRGDQSAISHEHATEYRQRWITWISKLGESGHLVDRGQPLEATGKVVDGKRSIVTDGPYAETKDVVGGYSLIEAKDLDHAVELSARCPIFEVGGLVEIRPVIKLGV